METHIYKTNEQNNRQPTQHFGIPCFVTKKNTDAWKYLHERKGKRPSIMCDDGLVFCYSQYDLVENLYILILLPALGQKVTSD